MKIYALIYKYKIKDKGSESLESEMTNLTHCIGESLEDVMSETETRIKARDGYIEHSCTFSLYNVMAINEILDEIKVSMPELVKNAKQREKLAKVAKALQDV